MAEDARFNEIDPRSSVESLLGPRTLDILRVNDPTSIEIINPWYRGGAETYVTDFMLSIDGVSKHLIAKACIKFGPKEAMGEWLERRAILANNGVKLPDLYAVDGATLVEEFIPYGFKEAYVVADDATRVALREDYIDTYKKVCGAGFTPKSLHDVRSHGDDVILIDVGEDIGGLSSQSPTDFAAALKAEQDLRSIIS